MATTRFKEHILVGTHALRPAASAVPVGALYSCTDHNKIYQSSGTAWSDYFVGASSSGGGTSGVGWVDV